MAEVKGRGKQSEKARQTRRRVVDAARELFVEQGYGATTLQAVADRGQVAVQTIYFTFGNKRSLLKEVVDTTIAGDDEPVATMDRPWFREAVAAPTARTQLRRHVRGTKQVIGRVAPVMEVFRAAAAIEPDIADMWEDPDPRFTVQSAAAKALVGKPDTRPGISARQAADVLYGLLSPELYLVFVRQRGWTPEKWERWVYDALCAQLCTDS